MHEASPEAHLADGGRAEGTATGPRPPNVLLVDDNPNNLLTLQHILQGLEANLVTAGSGKEALRWLADHEAVVVLLDVAMPDLNGFDTAKMIRLQPRLQHTPIIFVTAHASSGIDQETGYRLGAVDYLVKPLEPHIVCAKVAWFLERERQKQQLEKAIAEREAALAELRQKHELERVIAQREAALEALHLLNEELEYRVRQRTADLTAANEELEAFAYSVSHDLRAPLRAIDGFSQVLLEDYHNQLDAYGQKCLQRVRAASQRMAELIDCLLELSRKARVAMVREQVDLSALAQRIVAELQAAEPQRRVECCLAPGLTAQGDPKLLAAVLQNLLDNAWKFTGKTAAARIEFGLTEVEGRRAFFVRDNGAGFDMACAERLFGAFQRLHTPEEFPGIGIGLATVQRIIRRHGGQVWAEGALDQGATISFTLAP
jgi:signal transduction histidine kinase